MDPEKRDKLVRLYFDLGFTHNEILYYLAAKHRIILCHRHLKRILKKLSLYRRKHSDVVDVAVFILDQLKTSAQLWIQMDAFQMRFEWNKGIQRYCASVTGNFRS